MTDDPTLEQLREQISATDDAIVNAMNRRLELVAQVKAYKESQGIGFLDHDRERQMLEALVASNPGPLSTEGLRALFEFILDLSKREVSRPSSG